MWYVYILKCVRDRLYVGCTSDLKKRLKLHINGKVKSTCKRLPVKLIFYSCFPDKYIAFKFEKYLKSGSGRSFTNRHFV